MIYKVVLRQSEEGFSVSVPGLPGCWSQGATELEALENVRDAIQEYLSVVAEQVRGGEAPIPFPAPATGSRACASRHSAGGPSVHECCIHMLRLRLSLS